jgi:hypothetical protein
MVFENIGWPRQTCWSSQQGESECLVHHFWRRRRRERNNFYHFWFHTLDTVGNRLESDQITSCPDIKARSQLSANNVAHSFRGFWLNYSTFYIPIPLYTSLIHHFQFFVVFCFDCCVSSGVSFLLFLLSDHRILSSLRAQCTRLLSCLVSSLTLRNGFTLSKSQGT